MPDKPDDKDEHPPEKPEKKEEVVADTVDFRTAAKQAGYVLVPEGDHATLKAAETTLKELRSIFPEEARGKEGAFLGSLTEKAGQVESLQEQVASVETLKTENESLKTTNADLARGKKLSDMWGHVSRIAQMRNVRVHDRFIDEKKLVDFPLDKHDLGKQEGVQKFTEAVWKDVLEPAHKEQTTVIEQVSASRPQARPDGRRGDNKDDTDVTPAPVFGSVV